PNDSNLPNGPSHSSSRVSRVTPVHNRQFKTPVVRFLSYYDSSAQKANCWFIDTTGAAASHFPLLARFLRLPQAPKARRDGRAGANESLGMKATCGHYNGQSPRKFLALQPPKTSGRNP